MIDDIMDGVRKEAERCDSLQGFVLLHSLGGGTGSGLGSLLLRKLRDEYPHLVISTHSITPTVEHSTIVVEPYNAVLGLNQLLEYADTCTLYTNAAMEDACRRVLNHPAPGFNDLNALVSRVINIVSSGSRFPGADTAGLRKIAVSSVPYPRLHFLLPSLAPINTSQERLYARDNVHEVLHDVFDSHHSLCRVYKAAGETYITSACIFRGPVSVNEIEEEVLQFKRRHIHEFIDYIPDNVAVALTHTSALDAILSAVMLANCSGTPPCYCQTSLK